MDKLATFCLLIVYTTCAFRRIYQSDKNMSRTTVGVVGSKEEEHENHEIQFLKDLIEKKNWNIGHIKDYLIKIYESQTPKARSHPETYRIYFDNHKVLVHAFSMHEIDAMVNHQDFFKCPRGHRYFFDIFGNMWLDRQEDSNNHQNLFVEYFGYIKELKNSLLKTPVSFDNEAVENATKIHDMAMKLWNDIYFPIFKSLKSISTPILCANAEQRKSPKMTKK